MFQFEPETSSQVKFTGYSFVPLMSMLDSHLARSRLSPCKLQIPLALLFENEFFPYKYAKKDYFSNAFSNHYKLDFLTN